VPISGGTTGTAILKRWQGVTPIGKKMEKKCKRNLMTLQLAPTLLCTMEWSFIARNLLARGAVHEHNAVREHKISQLERFIVTKQIKQVTKNKIKGAG
jgi:hypothetical protein